MIPDTMITWRQRRYGGAEVVLPGTVDVPVPRRGEVLLRVQATALNAGDVRVMRGDPLLVRAVFGVTRPRQPVRGMDVAGTVVRVGSDVEALREGDLVVGQLAGGGLAAFATAPASALVPVPPGVTPAEAACLPIAGGTALQALDKAAVAADGRVLVIGASGGVGTFAVQLAAARGATVDALCGARSARIVRDLGATAVHDYHAVTPAHLDRGAYDAVIDIAGTAPLRDLQMLLRPGGMAVLVSGAGGRVLGPVRRMMAAAVRSRRDRRIAPLAAVASPDRTRRLVQMVADGELRPLIERTFSLEEAADALAHIDSGHALGKIVVAP